MKIQENSQQKSNNRDNQSFFAAKKESNSNRKELFFCSGLQANMTVGQPDDPYEQEADKIGRQVMHNFDQVTSLQRKTSDIFLQNLIQSKPVTNKISCGAQKGFFIMPHFTQPKCMECEEDEQLQSLNIQKSADGNTVDHAIESRIISTMGNGQSMDTLTRTAMESSFGADFSGVNIHTDTESVQMSQKMNAHAFTVGSDIFFNKGRYQPHTKEGAGLLAHELTHTVQQGAAVQNKRIYNKSLSYMLSKHNMSHLSSLKENTPSRKEMTQLQNLPEEELMQQMEVFESNEVDKVQKKDSRLSLRRCDRGSKKKNPQPKPKLKFKTNNGPTKGNCGSYVWGVQWLLPSKSDNTNGGWVIQKISEKVSGTKDDKSPLTMKDIGFNASNFPYWEAWRIPPSKTKTDFAVAGDPFDDTYNLKEQDKTEGTDKIKGDAQYYDNLKSLPSDFKKNNPDTYAGILYSTKTEPTTLTGGTGQIDHDLEAKWNCKTGSSDKKTKLTVTPDP